MKKLLITAAAFALAGSTAYAQPYGDHQGNGDRRDGGYQQGQGQGYRQGQGGQWERGGHLPDQYRSRNYIVRDYRRYGYAAPPRGHAYYRTNTGDVVMAAIATGVIASVINSNANTYNRPGYNQPAYQPGYAPGNNQPGYAPGYGRPPH